MTEVVLAQPLRWNFASGKGSVKNTGDFGFIALTDVLTIQYEKLF